MTTNTIARKTSPAANAKSVPASSNAKPNATPAPFAFKGANSMVRNAALSGIKSLAYIEGKSRDETLANMRLALGRKPSPADIAAVQLEYVIGRVAHKCGDNAKPVVDQLAHARDVVTRYAAPVQDGVKANALRKGQLGRRSVVEQKAMRAAESAFSLMKADLGLSDAKGLADKNAKAKAKRQPLMAGSTAQGKGAASATGITHSELVKPDGAPMTAKAAAEYLEGMSATMLMFCNKHAGAVTSEYGLAVKRFHGCLMELQKARIAKL